MTKELEKNNYSIDSGQLRVRGRTMRKIRHRFTESTFRHNYFEVEKYDFENWRHRELELRDFAEKLFGKEIGQSLDLVENEIRLFTWKSGKKYTCFSYPKGQTSLIGMRLCQEEIVITPGYEIAKRNELKTEVEQ